MILTKNRLKKIRKRIDDDDMLYYLKYSHLEPIREDDILKVEISDKATQFPDIMNNFTQTTKKVMVDKETDTYDELNKMDINAKYVLEGFDKSFKNDKQTQVNSFLVKEFEPKTPPSSDSQDEDGSPFLRNVDRGLRMAQLTGSAMLTALNLADTVGSAVLSPVIGSALDYLMSNPSHENEDEEVEEEIEEEVPTGSVDVPRHLARDRSRSRDDGDDTEGASGQSRDVNNMGHRLLRRGASRSRSISPASSGKASSAKTTPKKK